MKSKNTFPNGFNPFENVNENDLNDFLSNSRKREFLLSHTGISPRVFNLWKKLNLINIPQEKDTRPSIKLDFSDFIWLKIVKDLRHFGCSLNDIRKIKDLCYENAFPESEDFINKEEIIAMVMLNLKKKKNHSTEQLKEIEKTLSEKNLLKEVSDVVGKPMNQMEMQILAMLLNKSEVSLMVFNNSAIENFELDNTKKSAKNKKEKNINAGLSAYFFNKQIAQSLSETETKKVFSYPHINLPLQHYLTEFIIDLKNEEHIIRLKLLTEAEWNLLKEIRTGDYEEIKIIFKGNRIERLDKKKEVQKDVEARLIEIFRQDEFADINLKVANGKIVSFKKTTKQKFNT